MIIRYPCDGYLTAVNVDESWQDQPPEVDIKIDGPCAQDTDTASVDATNITAMKLPMQITQSNCFVVKFNSEFHWKKSTAPPSDDFISFSTYPGEAILPGIQLHLRSKNNNLRHNIESGRLHLLKSYIYFKHRPL